MRIGIDLGKRKSKTYHFLKHTYKHVKKRKTDIYIYICIYININMKEKLSVSTVSFYQILRFSFRSLFLSLVSFQVYPSLSWTRKLAGVQNPAPKLNPQWMPSHGNTMESQIQSFPERVRRHGSGDVPPQGRTRANWLRRRTKSVEHRVLAFLYKPSSAKHMSEKKKCEEKGIICGTHFWQAKVRWVAKDSPS